MVLYNKCGESPPTATHVLRVTELRLEREGEEGWGSGGGGSVCERFIRTRTSPGCLQRAPLQAACASDSIAWLTPWPTGMLAGECDPNWGNVKSPRITSVARLSQRTQGDTALLLLGVHCANESACVLTHHVQTRLECTRPSVINPKDFFFLSFK